ncbi:MAG TPA: 50S ribosomal protein L10 [Solirubrobacterales bacterium]|nr:50S ribosomal protein L10 [Solirubrobacterales bacterium]
MNRDEKAAVVDKVAADIEASEAIFAIDYRGISVTQAAELRGALRESDSSFTVVKNRLTKLAAAKAGVTSLDDVLTGPTALTFVRGDVAAAAKAITAFNKEADVLTFKGGFMGETLLDQDRFTAISKLPSRDTLNAQLAGVVASPIVTLTRGLGSMITTLAQQLQQVADQGLVSGSAPAEAPAEEKAPAEEPKAEEAPAEETAEEAPAEEAKTDDAPADADAEEAPAEEAPAEDAEESTDE